MCVCIYIYKACFFHAQKSEKNLLRFFLSWLPEEVPIQSVLFQKEKQEKKEARKARVSVAASKMSFVCFHQFCSCHLPSQEALLELEQSLLRGTSHCRAESLLRGRKRPGTGDTIGKQLCLEEGRCKGSGNATFSLCVCARNGISSLLF